MARGMKIIAVVAIALTAIFAVFYSIKPLEIFLTLAITVGTVSYHFLMRLFVGGVFSALMKNKADYNKKWFRVGKKEQKLYVALRVKKWKKHLPTYDPSLFDKQKHSWEEIIGATCQAELVHETIAVLSFVPILTISVFGSPAVFVITSVLSALFDLSFAALQRYNRPRILKILKSDASKAT